MKVRGRKTLSWGSYATSECVETDLEKSVRFETAMIASDF